MNHYSLKTTKKRNNILSARCKRARGGSQLLRHTARVLRETRAVRHSSLHRSGCVPHPSCASRLPRRRLAVFSKRPHWCRHNPGAQASLPSSGQRRPTAKLPKSGPASRRSHRQVSGRGPMMYPTVFEEFVPETSAHAARNRCRCNSANPVPRPPGRNPPVKGSDLSRGECGEFAG